ncbi:MAG TPA: hypothetical protein VMU83_05020 [Hanamia sp.]|nr:hypothetical protein [Hanamia sp.]
MSFSILVCTAITAHAQINEGSYLLGGSIGFNSSKNQNGSINKNESFYSNIQFGKVIKDNTVAGIIASYSFSNNGPTNKSNQFSAGVFYRKYKPLAKNFYFFGEVDALYNHSNQTYGPFQIGNDATRILSNGGTLSFTPGISYSVCKRMQIELSMLNIASISYAGTKYETTSSITNSVSTVNGNNFSGNINLNTSLLSNFGIGFKFLLGK